MEEEITYRRNDVEKGDADESAHAQFCGLTRSFTAIVLVLGFTGGVLWSVRSERSVWHECPARRWTNQIYATETTGLLPSSSSIPTWHCKYVCRNNPRQEKACVVNINYVYPSLAITSFYG